MGGLTPRKLRHAMVLLGLAESPILLQLLGLDRSYLFFVFSLAWAMALYNFIEPPRRALLLGLGVYVLTGFIAVPLLLAWLQPSPAEGPNGPLSHQLLGFVFGVGVREELCKAAALGVLLLAGRLFRLRFGSREGMLYGAMSGLAFAAAENLLALRSLGHLEEVTLAHGIPANPTVAVALTRLALTPLAHACWTATLGYACTVPLAAPPGVGRRGWHRWVVIAAALALTSTLHGLYDEAASGGNRVGVGLLLALSFTITIFLIGRPTGTATGTATADAKAAAIA